MLVVVIGCGIAIAIWPSFPNEDVKAPEKENRAAQRLTFYKLVRSELKWECEFIADGEFISADAGWGTVIIQNSYGAKRRVKWRIYFNEKFKRLPKNAQRLIGQPNKYLKDMSIGGWTYYEDGKLVDKGEI